MATERASRSRYLDAVARARRLRGSINFDPAGGKRWSAVVAAVDGALEVRVSEPKRSLARLRVSEERRWLQEHGFCRGYDCWTLPLAATVPDAEAAERWSAAIEAVFGVDPDSMTQTYASTGVSSHDVPPASASHEEHIAAALRAVVRGEFNRLNVFGGRPSAVWAWVWDIVGEPGLRVESSHRDDPGSEIDTWHVERSVNGCREGASELLRRVLKEWPDAHELPLFIDLLKPRE